MKMNLVMGYITGCSFEFLNDKNWLKRKLEEVVIKSDFTLINIFMQNFNPQGVTGVAVIGESHIAIHTWPEFGTFFLEVVSCATHEQAENAFNLFASLFEDASVSKQSLIISPSTSQAITE